MDSTQATEDDEAWARAEGVPSADQPFIQKYLDGRDALIAQENRQRSDYAFRQALSPMAKEASAILADIRAEEQRASWGLDVKESMADQSLSEVFPGMMFGLARNHMESTKSWQILKEMPKGALLHCHLRAMGSMDLLIQQAFDTEDICILAAAPLSSAKALEEVPFLFRHSSKAKDSASNSIWSASYGPNTPMPVRAAAAGFEGGEEAFRAWLMSRMTITQAESLQHHFGQNEVWRKMTSCFPIATSLSSYEPIFRKHVRSMLSQLREDGVSWVDIRDDFTMPFYRDGADEPDEGFEGYMEALQQTIDEFKASDEGKGFWGARLIWTGIRIFNTRTIVEDMKECIVMKQLYPDLICGYDLVGQEDLGRPLADLTSEIFWFRKTCAEEGVDIPFFFHAGETLGTGDQVDENLFDAILLGTRRIGHGFSLYKHPLLIEMVKEKKIHVESCPISNEVLRLTSNIMSHPLPALLARGVSCSLSNDDPAMMGQGSSGVTHDFWQAFQGWESLGLEGLASMAENSVRYASYDDCTAKEWTKQMKDGAYGGGIRAQRMKEWASEFEKFCAWVVLEYGEDRDLV